LLLLLLTNRTVMKKNILLGMFWAFVMHIMNAQEKVIFDTDFGADADDLGALVMLHYYVEKGECDLLGVACWQNEQDAVPAIHAVNKYYGHPDVPIGVRKDDTATYNIDWLYTNPLAEQLPHSKTFKSVPDATVMYRQLLSGQPDSSVTIVATGVLTNLKYLLQSEPDSISPLSGEELVRKKVKLFSIMGGDYPEGIQESNFRNSDSATLGTLFNNPNLPPMVFTGYKFGASIKVGKEFNTLPKSHPLYLGFYHFSKYAGWVNQDFKGEILDNASYDQIAVYYVFNKKSDYYKVITDGYNIVYPNGDNKWIEDPSAFDHAYLKLKVDPAIFEEELRAIMMYK